MYNARQQIVDSLKSKSNILVTVSTNPTVDELSAALGLTIILNNQDKRATAIFGGSVPPAINFLEPEKTFENSADSLRDFIIALDKEKADHLRYKVDGDLVKIFITPYKTTLSQADLEFSQGDYNVELVVALGVQDQDHLDKALDSHGKILHDATVVTITVGEKTSNLGSIDWHDGTASSLSEMIVSLADGLKGNSPVFDQQIATALLTGIVSATDRFSNEHTTSRSMTMAAQLMAAGANQQLIASKLEEAHNIGAGAQPVKADGTPAGEKSDGTGSELTIERPGRTSEAKNAGKDESEVKEEKLDTVITPPQDKKPGDESAKTPEEQAQADLEKQLAGLTAAPGGTMADIEKELKEKSGEEEKPVADDGKPLTASTDASMPGFEAPEPPVATPPAENPIVPTPPIPETPAPETAAPEVQTPPVEAETPIPAPAPEISLPELPPAPEPPVGEPGGQESTDQNQIVGERSLLSAPGDSSLPPMNSIQTSPNEGEQPTVDPFAGGPPTQVVASVSPDGNLGTTEGAAVLSQDAPQPAPQAPQLTVPELPPLPPLPTDANLPPLPPPPPPPPALGGAPGTTTSGAVSGDIFGDGATSGTTPPPPPPPAAEPGQFQIPGGGQPAQ